MGSRLPLRRRGNMDPKLVATVAFLVAISVASERLVEIIKGLIPALSKRQEDATKEGRRAATLQIIAVLSGILTAFLAMPASKGVLPGTLTSLPGILALGLMASGGSGFWNAILSYLLQIKNIKKSVALKGVG
jgi:drug/metabolite transporter (DMT)-like permease